MLGEILTQLNALRGYGQVRSTRQLAELWERAAGPEIAARTKVISLRNGTLQVGVANAALLSELAAFHQQRLLASVQSAGAELELRIARLKFRLRAM